MVNGHWRPRMVVVLKAQPLFRHEATVVHTGQAATLRPSGPLNQRARAPASRMAGRCCWRTLVRLVPFRQLRENISAFTFTLSPTHSTIARVLSPDLMSSIRLAFMLSRTFASPIG